MVNGYRYFVPFFADGSADFAGTVTAGGDCVIETGKPKCLSRHLTVTVATVFNGGWNTGGWQKYYFDYLQRLGRASFAGDSSAQPVQMD